jgi:hypothetical protein
MKGFVRTIVVALALAVCADAAMAVTAHAASSDRAFAQGLFAPIIKGLEKSKVPVLLPGALSAADLKGLRAELRSAGSDGYAIDLDYAADCNGASACYLGQITGGRSNGSKLHGTPVTLPIAATGYFVEGPCGASCSDSTITFDLHGVRYVFAEKGASLETLKGWTASIVTPSQLQGK